MTIQPVVSRRDLKRFVGLPYDLYQNDPVWVPPLRIEQKKLFNPKTNPFLLHCDYQLFLLLDGAKVIGRITAFVDKIAVDFWGERIGPERAVAAFWSV